MNKILTGILISAVTSTVILSAATVTGEDVPTAERLSHLYINNDTTQYNVKHDLAETNSESFDYNVSIDLPGVGQPVKLVWTPFVNLTKDSKFTLRAVNGDFVLARDVVLCSGSKKVGTMVSTGTTDGTTIMNNMSFQIDDVSDASFKNDIKRDNNLTFSAAASCDATALLQLTSSAGACTNLSIEIPQAIDNSSQAFKDYTAPAIKVGKTQHLVKVACDTPVCTIDTTAGSKVFTDTPATVGINLAKTQPVGSRHATKLCEGCDETVTSTCVTTIHVENNATFDITSLEVTPTMAVNDGMTVDVVFDSNTTETDKAMNALITLTDINISQNKESDITITYHPKENSVIEAGDVTSAVTLKAGTTALSLERDTNAHNDKLATFGTAGATVFTVPYMNSKHKTLVKITSLSNSDATLSAVITDQAGKSSPSIDLGTIAPNATKFLFSTFGPLKDGADAAGLKNAWSVVFTISGEATVVATMEGPNGGDIAISVF